MSKAVLLKLYWGTKVDPEVFTLVPEGELLLPMSLGQENDILVGFIDTFIGDSIEEIIESVEDHLAEFQVGVHCEPFIKFMQGQRYECFRTNATLYYYGTKETD